MPPDKPIKVPPSINIAKKIIRYDNMKIICYAAIKFTTYPNKYNISSMPIRPAAQSDAPALAQIYNHYITTSTATFEELEIGASDMAQRMMVIADHNLPWLISENAAGEINGYAYGAPWKARSAYRRSVEITVYITPGHSGAGLGTQLYRQLFKDLSARNLHMVIAGITLPNPASVALHEKMGLTHMGSFKEVGYKFERWIDVGYWQGILNEIEI